MLYRFLLFVFSLLPRRLKEVAEWVVSTKTTMGVTVVALDDNEQVMMFQHRYHSSGSWRLPGGHAEIGETPEQALEREMEEGGGAVVQPEAIVHITVSDRWPARTTLHYSARLIRLPQRTTAEVSGWRLFPVNQLPPNLPEGHVTAIRKALVYHGSAESASRVQ